MQRLVSGVLGHTELKANISFGLILICHHAFIIFFNILKRFSMQITRLHQYSQDKFVTELLWHARPC